MTFEEREAEYWAWAWKPRSLQEWAKVMPEAVHRAHCVFNPQCADGIHRDCYDARERAKKANSLP